MVHGQALRIIFSGCVPWETFQMRCIIMSALRLGIMDKCFLGFSHFHDLIISLKGEVWTHKTNLTPRLFIEVPTCQDRKVGGHIYVYYGYQFWLSVIFRFEFGTVLTWYSVFHFHIYVSIDVMFSLRIVMLCNIPFT